MFLCFADYEPKLLEFIIKTIDTLSFAVINLYVTK